MLFGKFFRNFRDDVFGRRREAKGLRWKSSENIPESVFDNSAPTPPSLRDTSTKRGGFRFYFMKNSIMSLPFGKLISLRAAAASE